MDPVLAKPTGACCVTDGSSYQSNSSQSELQQIRGIDTYVSTPNPSNANGNVLLFFADAFGLCTKNYLVMDAFAARGYLVLGVDYFSGDAVSKHTMTPLNDPNFDLKAWSQRHLKSSEEITEKWVAEVYLKYGKSEGVKFACVGYCWGGRIVCQQLAKNGICSVGAMAHPSFMNESHVSGVDAPLYIAAPNTDPLFMPEQRARTVEILALNKQKFNMQVVSDVGHGFATRAHPDDPYARWASNQVFENFIGWFDFWLMKQNTDP